MFRRILLRSHPAVAVAFIVWLTSCAALPSAGPLATAVQKEAAANATGALPFRLVEITPELLPQLRAEAQNIPFLALPRATPSVSRVGPGDLLTITVVEPAGGALFASNPGSTSGGGARVVTFENLPVDPSGNLVLPFAGLRKVAGLSTTAVAAALQSGLAGQAVHPQVVVTISHNLANRLTVAGSVKKPDFYDLVPGETLLQAVSAAGGPLNPPVDTIVRLRRKGAVTPIRLQALMDDPALDVYLHAGDVLILSPKPRTYTVLGAINKAVQESLPPYGLSLAQAIASAGGFADERADSRGVFLFRIGQVSSAPGPEPLPVLYMVDMNSASGIFLAQQVPLRDRDLVYLPDSRSNSWQKFLDALRIHFSLGSGVSTRY